MARAKKEKDSDVEVTAPDSSEKLSILQKITRDINKKYLGGKENVTPIISVGKHIHSFDMILATLEFLMKNLVEVFPGELCLQFQEPLVQERLV